MRRFVLSAACLIIPAAAFLLGCESDRGQRASTNDLGTVAAPNVSDSPLPTTITHDHQPPPRTPEN